MTKYVPAARELRDRYLEEINSGGGNFLPEAGGKYDVSRQLDAGGGFDARHGGSTPIAGSAEIKLLKAA